MNQQTDIRRWCLVSNPSAYITVDLQEVRNRNDAARHILAGFAEATPMLADIWRYLEEAIDDLTALSAEVIRLATELQNARLDRANLIAAARATIAADHDGERDPLSYLRDELDTLMPLSPAARRGI
jgi:hypothetical protein